MRGKVLLDLPSSPQEFYSALNFISFSWTPLLSFSLQTTGHAPHQLQSAGNPSEPGLPLHQGISLHQGFLSALLNVESSAPTTQSGTQESISI